MLQVDDAWESTLGRILRWVLFLPAAAVASVGSVVAARLFLLLTPGTVTWVDWIFYEGVAGFLFVVVGALVAPAAARFIAFLLVILWAIIAGFSLIGAIATRDRFSILAVVLAVVGGGVGYFFVEHRESTHQG